MQTKLENLLSESCKQTDAIRKIKNELQASKRDKREGITDVLIAQLGAQKVLYPQSNIERHPYTQAVMVLAQRAGINQNEIASLCGVSQSSVSQWMNGDCRAKLSSLKPLLTKLSPCLPGDEFHRMEVAEYGAFKLNPDWEKQMLLFFAGAVMAQPVEWHSLEAAFTEGIRQEAALGVIDIKQVNHSELEAINADIRKIEKAKHKYVAALSRNGIIADRSIEEFFDCEGFPYGVREEYIEISKRICEKYNLNVMDFYDFDGSHNLTSALRGIIQEKSEQSLKKETELKAAYDKKISDGIPVGNTDSSLFLSVLNTGFDRFSQENVLKLGKQLYGNARCPLAIEYCGKEFADYELNDFLKAPDGDFLLSNIFAFWLLNSVSSDIFSFKPIMLCGKLILNTSEGNNQVLSGDTNVKVFRLPSNRLVLCLEAREEKPSFRVFGGILNFEQETQFEKACFLFRAACADELLSCVERLDNYFPDDYGDISAPLKDTLIAEGYCIDGIEAIY